MPCQKMCLFIHEGWNDNSFCDRIAVRHCHIFSERILNKMCLTITVSIVFPSDHENYARGTTDKIHSKSYEETVAKHFTQRLQLVN